LIFPVANPLADKRTEFPEDVCGAEEIVLEICKAFSERDEIEEVFFENAQGIYEYEFVVAPNQREYVEKLNISIRKMLFQLDYHAPV
jgi:hypothetical protein